MNCENTYLNCSENDENNSDFLTNCYHNCDCMCYSDYCQDKYDGDKKRKKLKLSKTYRHHDVEILVEKRNERERYRVRAVNVAFAKLQQMVPAVACRSKRVSKVKTLKKAVEYILYLRHLLCMDEI